MSTIDLHDWIPVAEAAQILPSSRAGKQTALSTVYRWIAAGRLAYRKLGKWTYVNRMEVLGLMSPPQRVSPKGKPVPVPESDMERDRQTEATLREFGVIQ